MFKTRDRNTDRKIRHARVRKKISGTPEMPRLCVYRSLNNIYAQIIDAPENITFETPVQTKMVIKGIDKQQVGNLAADIRAIRKPEPYLGKGIKYENEVIRRKEGKSGKK